MSSVITFYSYKGGVGRTMALASIATLLVKRGKKVLAVDWDLEAPGLERYFAEFIDVAEYLEQDRGLLDLLIDAWDNGGTGQWPDWRRYLQQVKLPNGELALLTAGKRGEQYAANLERFDWSGFFEQRRGGDFFEFLRTEWLEDFDFTLIDSRTGLSDAGGVCTILMPDVLVAMFTANHQSLYGVRDVIDLAQKSRQNLVHDRMRLQVLPIPSRWDGRGNVDEAQKWLALIAKVMSESFSGWVPRGYTALQMVERLKIPHVGQFSFGEKLPVLSHSTTDPELPGYAYEAAATLLANDFANAGMLLGVPPELKETDLLAERPATFPTRGEYEYDVFVSYQRHSVVDLWTSTLFLPELRKWLSAYIPREPSFFIDKHVVEVGEAWRERRGEALRRSRVLLAILTPSYFESDWCRTEWMTFAQREELVGVQPLIFAVVLAGRGHYPREVERRAMVDMTRFATNSVQFKKTRGFLEFERAIQPMAEGLADMLAAVPPYSPRWPVVTDVSNDNLSSPSARLLQLPADP
jgi:MinD-like ATPase involved in chromosome partitioning or flagellar assembly